MAAELKEKVAMLSVTAGKDAEDVLPQKKTSWKEKLTYMRDNITLEPIMFCYVLPSVMSSLATQNLNLEKACRVNLNYTDEVCTALAERNTQNYTTEESQVQQLVAMMTVWKTMVQSALPVLLMLFMGAWSDRFGLRKPLILLPIVGEFLTSISLIICTYFFYELPMEVAGFAEAIFPALTGGWFIMFMATFSYIGDTSSIEERTIRIGAVNVLISISVSIGLGLSGILYVKLGFYGVFTLSAVLYIVGFVYGLRRIKEVAKVPLDSKGRKISKIKSFLDTRQIKDTLRVVFKKGARNRKMRVIMLNVVVMVIIGPLHGEMAVTYLFTRYKFNWNEVDYSIFSTFCTVTGLLGTIFSLCVFTQYMKLDDALLGVISCTSKVLSSFVYALAPTSLIFYIGPLVEILNGTSFTAMRSIISKLVPADELGKVMSVFGVSEALMPLVYGPMYSTVYRLTMDTMPGLFFLLGGAMTAPAILIFIWIYKEHKMDALEAKNATIAAKEMEVILKNDVI